MRVVDLFAGCGGLSKGFANAGFNVVAAFDAWSSAVECYKINFDHPIFEEDLSDADSVVSLIGHYNPDMIIGGPPCQDFSHAGKRSEGERADLTRVYSNIISQIRPKWFLMENVDRACQSKAFAQAREIFKDAGYGLTERVLNASRCGAPQNRKRFFCIGLLGASDGFLNSIIDKLLSDKQMTIREYLGNELGVEHYYRHPRNYSRRGIFSIDEPAPTVRGVNRPVPKGYPGHPNDPVSVTQELRSLSTLERARVQTFPNDYKWVGSKTELEQMIGNAVPVKLAEFVANSIKQYSTTTNQEVSQEKWVTLKIG